MMVRLEEQSGLTEADQRARFNSMMVRLEERKKNFRAGIGKKFQFHDGAIGRL